MQAYNETVQEVAARLHVDVERGLTLEQVQSRTQIYGKNQLVQGKKLNPFFLFLGQFKSFIIYILLFALLLSVLVAEYTDAGVIFVILILNAGLGFFQEYRAEKAIESLKKLASLHARVLRNGQVVIIDASDVVPGDILVLEEGMKVPADARLIEVRSLETSEASLTGESAPVSKHINPLAAEVALAERTNMVYAGTGVTKGRARAIVIGTGMLTELGKIAQMMNEIKDDGTPLQKKLQRLGGFIGVFVILASVLVFVLSVIEKGIYSLLLEGKYLEFIIASKDLLLTAVSLAVAAVPEGLPAIVTIALAIGVRKMLKRNALIRTLPSIESLGEITVICSDKTGTLTKNEMTVKRVYVNGAEFEVSGTGYNIEGDVTGTRLLNESDALVFTIGALCNNASLQKNANGVTIDGDPTEIALLTSAEKARLRIDNLAKEYVRVDELPFDSERKMMSVLCENKGKKYVYTKGAPELVLEKCTRVLWNGRIIALDAKKKELILHMNEEFATRALRVIGCAYKPFLKKGVYEEGLTFAGLQGMIDPPHDEVKNSIATCKQAGIRVIMITGDNMHTAEAIAREIGIDGEVMEGTAFSKLEEAEQWYALRNVNVFARVEPRHKMLIVDLLKRKGEIVAMTGDGVNDAPSIKKADLGIAMGITGTDVTKEASDMILLDDNFSSIVSAIEEGRGIEDNIQKTVQYLFSCNFAEVLIVFFAILMQWELPMTAIMLLWLNLVTDGLPALALSADPVSKDVMKRPPRKPHSPIIGSRMLASIIIVALLITFAVLGVFWWASDYYSYLPQEAWMNRIQTIALTMLVMLELVPLYVIRTAYNQSLWSNKYVVGALVSVVLLHLLALYTPLHVLLGLTPLDGTDWGVILSVSLGLFALISLSVSLTRRMFRA